MNTSVIYALAAAALFGASTPLAKLLGAEIPPVMLAGLLYLGSGVGLLMVRCVRDRGWKASGLQASEWPWLMGAIVFGGVLGPVALMAGLSLTSGATASLMLNLEPVLTALLAWVVFKENADRRIVLGMLAIIVGGVVLSWPSGQASNGSQSWLGPLAVAFACLCWAVDNNLTRKVSAADALYIAGAKGLFAGLVNCTIAWGMGAGSVRLEVLSPTLLIGFLGYGVSLVLFVLALRGLGAARTGAYFSTAPFLGAAISIMVLGESVSLLFWLAAAFMLLGVWLHLTEQHEHNHRHVAQEHTHRHTHDEHHRHEHAEGVAPGEPHSHTHQHLPIAHSHPHFPDIHHRHRH